MPQEGEGNARETEEAVFLPRLSPSDGEPVL